MSNPRGPNYSKPSKKVKFLVGIWVIVVCLEIVLPINYWVVNFGWGFFNNSNYDVLTQWQLGFIFLPNRRLSASGLLEQRIGPQNSS